MSRTRAAFASTNAISSFSSIVLLVVAAYLLLSGENFRGLVQSHTPPGQFLYLLSKLAALLVFILAWWQILMGIFKKVSARQHMLLGAGLFLLVVLHVVMFVSAVSVRVGSLTLGMLVPNFWGGYYQMGLSFGILGLILLSIAVGFAALRHRLGSYWKFAHSMVYLVFIVATIHGWMIGSDFNREGYRYFIVLACLSIVLAFLYRKLANIKMAWHQG